MPLLRPEVSKLLDAANLGRNASKDIKEQLEAAGLGLEETLGNLRTLRDFSESEASKIRINEAVLKMHGVMKEEGASIPSINIIITDSSATSDSATNDNVIVHNPILLPRELHNKETVQ